MINQILKQVKAHKKYKDISDTVVKKEIQTHLKSHPNASEDKQTIKEIRSKLHKIYSSFQTKKKNKIEKLIKKINNKCPLETTDQLLSNTVSTKERLPNYQSIYSQIFKITGKPKTILDLGCGLNLFSYPFMEINEPTYYGYDINEKDAEFLNKYIKKMKIEGGVEILDLENLKSVKRLPKADLVFLFKVVDILKGKKYAEDVLEILIKNNKYLVVSFATRTISRRKMNNPYRNGFEIMLKRKEWNFEKFQTENESFYVIKK